MTELFEYGKHTALQLAIETALEAHDGQVDKAGEAYILHPLRVMLAVQPQGEFAMICAVLHDVVEDTDVTLAAIRARFGEDVEYVVGLLTQGKGEEYTEYIKRVASDTVATKIKVADIYDNLRPDRSKGRPKNALEKYGKALAVLEQ